jgi:hypothetical protein
MKTVLDSVDSHDMLLVPDVVLDCRDRFLDDVTLNDVQEALGIAVKKIRSAPDGISEAFSVAGKVTSGQY